MTNNYTPADFLIKLKNASMSKKRSIMVRKTNIVASIAKVLKDDGYISKITDKDGSLEIELAYLKKEPVLIDIKIISRPGLRVYLKSKQLARKKGPSRYIISTPHGVMNSHEAIKKNIGGEAIAEII